MNATSLIFDALFVVTSVIMIRQAYRKGFLQTVIRTVGYIAVSLLAYFGGRALSEACYQLFVHDRLEASLEHALAASSASNDFAEKITAAVQKLPAIVRHLMEQAGFSGEALAEQLSGSVEESAAELSRLMMDTVVHPLVTALLYGICFLVLFAAGMVLVRCLIKVTGGVRHIPIVGTLNSLIGGLMGVVQAAVIWFAIVIALDFLISMTGGFEWLNNETLQDSLILGRFYTMLQNSLLKIGLELPGRGMI